MLELRSVKAAYGPIAALHGISLSVPRGSIVTLLGANGAGKTTTLRVTAGLMAPVAGDVIYDGQRITGITADQAVGRGLVLVPEGRQIFAPFTVEENLKLGAYTRNDGAGVRADMERVYDYFPRLRERRKQVAGTLSGGEQQMLAIGRALMARPRMLLLDEPSLGLAPLIVREIFRIIRTINEEEKVTILLVEQDAKLALNTASYGYVLETGEIAVEGPAKELGDNETIRRSYLGY